MRKIVIFTILFGLLFGNLVVSQAFSFKKETEINEKIREERDFEKEIKNIKEIVPEVELILPREEKIRGQVEIKGRVKDANSVEFYYQLPGSASAIYLGKAQQREKDLWELSFDTNSVPNGKYQLFAKITNPYGEYESKKREIIIENEIPKRPKQTEELEKEHRKVKNDIGTIDKEIEQKKEKAKEEISSKAMVEEEKEALKKKAEEFIEKVKKEKQIEKETKEKEKEKRVKEKEVEKVTKEVEKLQEIPKVEARIIEEEKKVRLEIEKTELEKMKTQIEVFNKNLGETRAEKEKVKEEIIKKTKPEEKREVSEKIKQLEKEIKEKEEVKIEKEKVLIKDSDNDGLLDEFEISIGTDSFNPDSDGDGFLDGDEYRFGYNPLKAGAADKIVYSDARRASPQKTDFYYIERVTSIVLPTGQSGIKIEGKGLPNSFVTVYIYSSPIVMVTKTDGNGNWSIVLDKPLADGTHEVYTTVTNNHGEITARSEPFVFEKSGERIVAITVAGLLSEKTISPIQTYQLNFLALVIALIVLAIGIALIIIGISVQKKIKKRERNQLT